VIGHRSPISGVAVCGDKYVATAGYDNQVIVWDLQSGRALSRGSHDHLANQCAFSPDGKHLVSASSDYTARVWSVPELSLQAVLADHEDDVEMAVFHPTEDLIATASRDYRVRVFSRDGRLLRRFEGHGADALSVEWIAGSTDLVSSGDDGTIRRWSLNEGRQVGIYDLEGIETDTVVVTPDGTIYAGTDEGEIITIIAGSRKSMTAHAAGIKRLAYSVEREMLVSLSYDRMIKIWSCGSDELRVLADATMPADVWARTCAFGPDDKLILGSFGSRFRQYRYAKREWCSPAPATLGVNAVCVMDGSRYTIGDAGWLWRDGVKQRELGSLCNFLLPWGGQLLTGGQAGTLFDALTGETVLQHRSPLNCGAAYVLEGKHRAVIGTYTGEGLVFEKSGLDGKPALLTTLRLHNNAVKGVAQAKNQLFSVCADKSCVWVDAVDHTVQHRISQAHGRIANACAALVDGSFASVGRDRIMRIWTGNEARGVQTPHRNSIKCIAADDTGRFLASGSYGGHVALFDRERWQWCWNERASFSGISSIAFDPQHRLFLASSYDGMIYEIELPADA